MILQLPYTFRIQTVYEYDAISIHIISFYAKPQQTALSHCSSLKPALFSRNSSEVEPRRAYSSEVEPRRI